MKIRWFKIFYLMIIIPSLSTYFWNKGYHGLVIGVMMFYIQLLLAYHNPSEYIK
jgi:hypothetical protein